LSDSDASHHRVDRLAHERGHDRVQVRQRLKAAQLASRRFRFGFGRQFGHYITDLDRTQPLHRELKSDSDASHHRVDRLAHERGHDRVQVRQRRQRVEDVQLASRRFRFGFGRQFGHYITDLDRTQPLHRELNGPDLGKWEISRKKEGLLREVTYREAVRFL
jgi:hypothetical protein